MSPVEVILTKLYGRPTRTAYSSAGASVGTSSTLLIKQNPNRLGLTIVNLSSADLFVSPLESVSSSSGFYLGPLGGTISLNIMDDFTLQALQWYGVASVIGAQYFLIEQLAMDPSK
jgi:hypothetical protein